MQKRQTTVRTALLSSAFALAALAPALAASTHSADQKRLLALQGPRAEAARTAAHAGNAFGRLSAKATYTVLYKFLGGSDGSGSGANVAFDSAGNLYGTTDFGGPSFDGVVFKLTPGGTESVLHTFSGSDGSQPDGAVIVMSNGDLIGSTTSGGASDNGTLFSLSAKGKLKTLHDLSSTDGSEVRGNLLQDKSGNLYGTALFSGANSSGTVFEYAADGTFTVLHAFAADGSDGEYPEHGLVADKAGNMYGVTAFGGASGEGTVFEITAKGKFKSLYSFTDGADGGFLYGRLDIDKAGNLYGSTVDGGASNNGTVFKMSPTGTLTTLYNFAGGTDLGSPQGDMLLVGKKLYSTAETGGDASCQCGGIYEVTAKGKDKILHAFVGTDGSGYAAGLTLSNNLFYGTAQSGGNNENGVVFNVTKK